MRWLYFAAFVALIALTETWWIPHLLGADTDSVHHWYWATQEFAKASMAVVIAHLAPRRYAVHALGASIWWVTQGVQELRGSNDGIHDTWEYGLLAFYFLTMLITTRNEGRS